jgi:putative spermidine/putrescine transport system substrate-binding protein
VRTISSTGPQLVVRGAYVPAPPAGAIGVGWSSKDGGKTWRLPPYNRPVPAATGESRFRRALPAALAATIAVLAAAFASASGAAQSSLSIVAWHGLLESQWVKPFEQSSGCKVKAAYASSSNELVVDLRTGKYDVGSVSADVARALIGEKTVAPLNLKLVPAVKTFLPAFRAPAATTVSGRAYGVAIHWAADVLLYNTQRVKPAPSSWRSIYSPRFRGKITVPNDPMQIADAALYLKTAQPKLGIRDPFELTKQQFNAAVVLLRHQKPLVGSYWDYPADEVQAFRDGHAVIGAGWPWQTATLEAAKVPVAEVSPREGITGWTDSWMLAAASRHRICAYKWFRYASTPSVQAQIAKSYGAAPVSAAACVAMERASKGSCAELRGNATPVLLRSVHFWKTPLTDCGGAGGNRCVGYSGWQKAWARIHA